MLFYSVMPPLALLVRNIRQAVALFVATVLVVAAPRRSRASGTSEDFGYFSLVNFLYFFAVGIVALLAFLRLREQNLTSCMRRLDSCCRCPRC